MHREWDEGRQGEVSISPKAPRRWAWFGRWLGLTLLANGSVHSLGYALRAVDGKFVPFRPDKVGGVRLHWNFESIGPYFESLFLARENPDMFRLHLELCLACAALLLWPRVRLAMVLVAVWGIALLTQVYEDLIRFQLGRGPAWRVDLQYFVPAKDYLREAVGIVPVAVVSALVAIAVAIAVRSGHRFLLSQLESFEQAPRAQRWGVAVVLVVLVTLTAALNRGYDARLRSTHSVLALWAENRARAASLWVSEENATEKLVAAFEPAPQPLALEARPNVYIFLMESYGGALWSEKNLAVQWLPRLRAMDRRLEDEGFSRASVWGEAPVCGAGSWLSVAALNVGWEVREQETYGVLARNSLVRHLAEPHSIFGRLKSAGYRTVAVQPGNSRRQRSILWGAEEQVDQRDLAYGGTKFGFGKVPDQFTLARIEDLKSPAKPMAVFFENVSSHHPWHVPLPLPWSDALDDGRYRRAGAMQLGLREKTPAYLVATAYSFEILTRYLECCVEKDALVVIAGDHQPPLKRCERDPWIVPVHVVSGDQTLVQQFMEGLDARDGLLLDVQDSAPIGLWELSPRLLGALRSAKMQAPRSEVDASSAPRLKAAVADSDG